MANGFSQDIESNWGSGRSSRNRSLSMSDVERAEYRNRSLRLDAPAGVSLLENRLVHQDLLEILDFLPNSFVDLLFLDPPYNLDKNWNSVSFRKVSTDEYAHRLDSWLSPLMRTLKPHASVYICGDWQSAAAIQEVAQRHLLLRNRITWEREKGRGAKSNWKNCSEDIWFGTVSEDYYFNAEDVKLKRRVVAPYTDAAGEPKDWERTKAGNYRLTHPSNLWTDLTVPFWSMPENTDHPTQKPEKLLAKLVLASSRPGDMVFDPFAGVGTSAVVAKKLGRRFLGVEIDEWYCCLAQKRLALAETNSSIQGYSQGVFWERNTYREQRKRATTPPLPSSLF